VRRRWKADNLKDSGSNVSETALPSYDTEVSPRFSIVVPTLDRTDVLEVFLTSLLGQRYRSFEVILVDQNPDDRLAPLVTRFQNRLRVRWIRQQECNASLARNKGARHAAGEWLAFADDDCTYHDGTLAALSATMENQCAARLISGAVICEDGKPLAHNFLRSGRIGKFNSFTRSSEGCLFIKRTAFLALGGFDSRFGPGAPYHAAEGVEFEMRFLSRFGSGATWFDASIYCFHPRKREPFDPTLLVRARQYSRGMAIVPTYHPSLAAWLHIAYKFSYYWGGSFFSRGALRTYFKMRYLGLIDGIRLGLSNGPQRQF
jgi:glycosyltransferase involved in cell wall biosynthesis